jgi:hypothetical protein
MRHYEKILEKILGQHLSMKTVLDSALFREDPPDDPDALPTTPTRRSSRWKEALEPLLVHHPPPLRARRFIHQPEARVLVQPPRRVQPLEGVQHGTAVVPRIDKVLRSLQQRPPGTLDAQGIRDDEPADGRASVFVFAMLPVDGDRAFGPI